MDKKVIYTAILGKYDLLKDPLVVTPGWKYFCFTNNKDLKSDVWDIVYMNLQTVKQVRRIKLLPPFEYDLCIWVDASIEVSCNLDHFVRDNHQGYFTLMRHPHRDCVYTEAEACLKRNKDTPSVIREQIDKYRRLRYPSNNGMVATGLLIRNNCKQVKDFCEHWWKEIEMHSKRDQLSFNFTAHQHPIKFTLISFSVIEGSDFKLYLHHNNKIL
jgi:hypothetical protein